MPPITEMDCDVSGEIGDSSGTSYGRAAGSAKTKWQSHNISDVEKKSVIIFDWDDTLLASTFLSGEGYRLDSTDPLPEELYQQFRQLETAVIAILTTALQYGLVRIITNAETGWVQMSAEKWLPGVLPLLKRMQVVSARSTYEGQFPTHQYHNAANRWKKKQLSFLWKHSCFEEQIRQAFELHKTGADLGVLSEADTNSATPRCIKNVLSFGDSQAEREAVHNVTRNLKWTLTKSVKFHERPTPEQLTRQIELVQNCFQTICSANEDMDLMLTVTAKW